MTDYFPRAIGATFLMLLANVAAADCDSVTATSKAELDAAVTDYNDNCTDGDLLTVTLDGTLLLTSPMPTVDHASTAVLRIVDGTLQGGGTNRLSRFRDGNVVFERTLLRNFSSANGGVARIDADAVVTLINTTVTENQATSGAAFLNSGTLNVINSTIADNIRGTNGGAIFNSGGTLNLSNSIIANTVNTSGQPVADCLSNSSGTVTLSEGFSNLIETDSQAGCDANNEALSGDPSLGPLQDNGGLVMTMALENGSVAIDAGSDAAAVDANGVALETDARGNGANRIIGAAVDLGAFEATVIPDDDGDGVDNSVDNCLEVANADQLDSDNDGFGNICDPDLNNDLIVNFTDIGLWSPFFNTATSGNPSAEEADFNGDGLVNFADYAIYIDFFLNEPGPSAIAP